METKDVVILEVQINTTGSGGAATTPEKTKKDIDAVATSILGLQQANKKLREERNKVDASTDDGKKKIKELNELLDKNNKTIKDNSSSLEKQRLNIGNYASALDRLVPGLGGAVQGISGMTKASYAFIATGIGAIIAALGIALAAVVTWVKQSSTAMDFLEDATAAVGAVLNVVIDRVSKFIDGMIKFFSGDFVGGFNDIASSMTGIGDEMAREIKLAQQLAAAIRDLEDAEINYAIRAAETENVIKRLLLQSKNRTLSEKERIAILDQAIQKEKELTQDLVKNKEEALRIANEEANQRLELKRKAGETEVQFGKRIIAELQKEGAKQLDAERDAIKDALIARENAEGQSLALLEKVQNQRDALEEKAIEERRKREEEEKKRSDEAREQRIADYELELERMREADEKRKSYLLTFELEVETEIGKSLERVKKLRAKQDKEQEDSNKKRLAKRKADDQEEYNSKVALAGAAIDFARNAFGRMKAVAIAEAVVNTALGVVRALKDYPYPYSAVIGALVGASGAVTIGKIASAKYAKGGEIKPTHKHWTVGGNSHSQGGTKYYGEDGNVIEAERGEGIYVMKRTAEEARSLSAHNVSHGGRSWMPGAYPGMKRYAEGGEVILNNRTTTTLSLDRVVNAIADMNIFVRVTEINDAQSQLSQKQTEAMVIS